MPPGNEPSDEQSESLGKAPAGGPHEGEAPRERIGRLAGEHHHELVKHVRRGGLRDSLAHDAEDAVQELYRKLLQRGADLAQADNPLALLKTSVKNEALALEKKRQRRSQHETRLDEIENEERSGQLELSTPSVLDRLVDPPITTEEFERIARRLSAEEQKVLDMQLAGMTSKEIAERAGMSQDQAERRVARMRSQLKALLSHVIQGWVRK